jgi:hypothetical protein
MAEMMRHAHEVAQGERFAFGANWVRFLKVLFSLTARLLGGWGSPMWYIKDIVRVHANSLFLVKE